MDLCQLSPGDSGREGGEVVGTSNGVEVALDGTV